MEITVTERVPAETFTPGEFLRDELEARGWTQGDLAEILGLSLRLVNEVIAGKRAITPETAKRLGEAFGTGAQFWMNLETAHQLSRTRVDQSAISRRARLFGMAPIKEMIRRHWLEQSDNINVLEKQVLDFFAIKIIDEEPKWLPHAARKSTAYAQVTAAQRAWLSRARHLARATSAKPFRDSLVDEALNRLRPLAHDPEEARRIPRILAECGIRFLVIEPLQQTRIDGACFWLDARSPVVVLSVRYDRIDAFWHTLIHELAHVKNRDATSNDWMLDVDLINDNRTAGEERPEAEKKADEFAVNYLVPPEALEDFITRIRPLYSKKKIIGFASTIGVHPGIVVGQLQFRKEITYAQNREMLVKVREFVVQSTLTDGWGNFPSASFVIEARA